MLDPYNQSQPAVNRRVRNCETILMRPNICIDWILVKLAQNAELPSLKWSSLKYVCRMEDEADGKEEAYSGRDFCEASAG